jgi:hypothetical protein
VEAVWDDQIHQDSNTRFDGIENRTDIEVHYSADDVTSKSQRIGGNFADLLEAISQCGAANKTDFYHGAGTLLNAQSSRLMVDVTAIEVAEATMHETWALADGGFTISALVRHRFVGVLSVIQMTRTPQNVQPRVFWRTFGTAMSSQMAARVIPWASGGFRPGCLDLNTLVKQASVRIAGFAVLAADFANTVETLLARGIAATLFG